jgi:DNA-directed RNA polymerase specialized sigma24 family protein
LAGLEPVIRRALARYAQFLGRFLGQDDIDELTQMVLTEVSRAGQAPQSLGGLAVTIARRRLLDWFKKTSAQSTCKAVGDQIDERGELPECRDFHLDLMAAMELIPKDMQEVFYACGIDGRSRDEAVKRLGITLHQVRVLYSSAIAIVAEFLEIELPKKPANGAPDPHVSDDITN